MSRLLQGRRTVTVLTGVIALLLLTATMVAASHQFTDVPNSSPYHADISWAKDHGITGGCSATKYCPKNNVTREQMATFLHNTHNIAPTLTFDSSTTAQSFTSTAFTNLTGASVSVPVLGTNTARLLITFSAESYCNDPDWCSVRILVDGAEATPADGSDFAFDSGQGTADGLGASIDGWEGHSMQRTALVSSGSHTVTVQGLVITGGASKELRLDDWLLSVQTFIQ